MCISSEIRVNFEMKGVIVMGYLCFSTFAKALQPAMQPPNDDKDVVEILLGWITEKPSVLDKKGNPVTIAPSLISELLKQKVNVPKVIKNECTTKSILTETINHFENKVIPFLNPYICSDFYFNIKSLVDGDSTIADKKKKELNALYDCSKDAEFLAQIFLYAVNKENRDFDIPVESNDIPLLDETSYECPICHSQLIQYVKNSPVKKYSIVKIYPEDVSGYEDDFADITKPNKLDAPANLIALCRTHADEYMDIPSADDCRKLQMIKKRMSDSKKVRMSINNSSLEDEISDVLNRLTEAIPESDLVELPLSALRIDQKILPENHMLRADEKARVLKYYNFINTLFSDLDRTGTKVFEHIASEIHIVYEKLDDGTQTQDQIVQALSEWIRNKTQLGAEYQRAYDIVVAFFIQNCEVFHEISE